MNIIMTKEDINQYLSMLEDELLNNSEQIPIKLSRSWAGQFPDEAAVYIFREDDMFCYVG